MKQEVQRQWYVVYSKPNREEYARYHLQRKGIEVFFPRLQLPVPQVKQRHTIPLFPSYLFVQLHLPGEHYAVLWCPGVKCLVSFNGAPAPLDDKVVQFLKEQATEDGIIGASSSLSVGQEVCVIKGPFEGLKGIIQNPPDAKGRIRLLMHLLNRDLSVTLPIHHVNGDWTVTHDEAGRQQTYTYAS
ncbi:MAG: transcription termination/antitermination protein NusG [Candidatus Binatia bacterium]